MGFYGVVGGYTVMGLWGFTVCWGLYGYGVVRFYGTSCSPLHQTGGKGNAMQASVKGLHFGEIGLFFILRIIYTAFWPTFVVKLQQHEKG